MQCRLALLATCVVLFSSCHRSAESPQLPPASSVETSGGLLGARLGMTMEEAHEKLDRLQKEDAAGASEGQGNGEREGGERAAWMLKGTEFQWIIAWANKSGRIYKLSSSLRADQPKPFGEIGDLAHTTGGDSATAVWDVPRPDGWSYRVVAKGPERRANIIYLYAVSQRAD